MPWRGEGMELAEQLSGLFLSVKAHAEYFRP